MHRVSINVLQFQIGLSLSAYCFWVDHLDKIGVNLKILHEFRETKHV